MGKTNNNKKRTKKPNLIEIYLMLGFLSLILLHILGSFWHSFYSWGFSYSSVLPNNISLFIGAISILSVFGVFIFRDKLNFNIVEKFQLPHNSKSITMLFSIVTSVILAFVLFIFRSQAHIYGDGFSMLNFCSTYQPLEIIDQHKLQLLAVYWHQLTFKIISSFTSFNNEEIFAFTNVLGGVIGLWGIYKIAGVLSRSRKERLFFLIISLSSASIILFFGYIENYTWATSFMLWALYYSIRYSQKTCTIFPLLFCSLTAFAFHMITLPALVTALFIFLYRNNSFQKIFDSIKRLHLVIIVLVGSLSILLFAQIKGLSTFVPLWDIPNNNYSLFSLSHLSDIFNLILLIAPLGLLLFIFSIKRNDNLKNDSTEKVLFVLSILTFLSACFIDPHLGMMRDFDLFSFFGIPLTLWAGYRFSRMYTDNKFPPWIIAASLILVFVHILPNLYEKNHPHIAVEHLDAVLWEDPHYQIDYQDAFRGLSWGCILSEETNRNDLSIKYYSRRIKSENSDPTTLYNLGLLNNKRNQLDSARYYLQKGMELYPREPKFLSKLSEVECKLNNFKLAESYARASLEINSKYEQGLNALAIILTAQNKDKEALVYFRKVNVLIPNKYKNILNLGLCYSRGINSDSALYYLNKAVLLAPETQKPNILVNLINLSQYLKNTEETEAYLKQLKSIAPNSQILKKLEKEIYGQ